jgi:hypothetical protein
MTGVSADAAVREPTDACDLAGLAGGAGAGVHDGTPITVAFDGTFFARWAKKVAQARWAYNGAAQGGKKIAFGNTWVIAAIVVQLPFCSSPAALPVLFRLWRGKGPWQDLEDAYRRDSLAKARAALGGDEFDRACSRGSGLSFDDAFSLAMAGPA